MKNIFNKYKKNELGPTDKIMYELGLVVALIIIVMCMLYLITGISVYSFSYRCIFNRLFNLPCPGCGGTRASLALIHGEILKSFYYYPPLLYAVVVYVIFMFRCFLYKYFGLTKSEDGAVVKYIYIGIALILLQWLVKLVAQLAFGYAWFERF